MSCFNLRTILETVKAASRDPRFSRTSFVVLSAILDRLTDADKVRLAVVDLASMTGLSNRTVERCLCEIRGLDLLTVKRRGETRSGTVNEFSIDARFVKIVATRAELKPVQMTVSAGVGFPDRIESHPAGVLPAAVKPAVSGDHLEDETRTLSDRDIYISTRARAGEISGQKSEQPASVDQLLPESRENLASTRHHVGGLIQKDHASTRHHVGGLIPSGNTKKPAPTPAAPTLDFGGTGGSEWLRVCPKEGIHATLKTNTGKEVLRHVSRRMLARIAASIGKPIQDTEDRVIMALEGWRATGFCGPHQGYEDLLARDAMGKQVRQYASAPEEKTIFPANYSSSEVDEWRADYAAAKALGQVS